MPDQNKNIIVVGAGIVGVSTALWLQRSGHQVTLIDRKDPGEETSYGNGGVLAACAIVPVTTPGLIKKIPKMLLDPRQPLFLKWRQLPRLTPWFLRYLRHCNVKDCTRIAQALNAITSDSLSDHQALAAGTPAEKWLRPCSYLYLYDHRDGLAADHFSWQLRKENGFHWEELDAAALKDYDPFYQESIACALRMENHGIIRDPGRYTKDLAAHFLSQGGRLVNGEVYSIVRDKDKVSGVVVNKDTITCSTVVITAGVWSSLFTRAFGLKIPLESERGYHVELWEPNIMPKSPVMLASKKCVITPMDGRIRIAGIVEFGGLRAAPSPRVFNLLIHSLRKYVPQLSWKETRTWMGHRPTLTDSLPVIGEVPNLKGAFLGFGHQHIGLTGGPKTGQILAQIISGQTPNMDILPYAPSRFSSV